MKEKHWKEKQPERQMVEQISIAISIKGFAGAQWF